MTAWGTGRGRGSNVSGRQGLHCRWTQLPCTTHTCAAACTAPQPRGSTHTPGQRRSPCPTAAGRRGAGRAGRPAVSARRQVRLPAPHRLQLPHTCSAQAARSGCCRPACLPPHRVGHVGVGRGVVRAGLPHVGALAQVGAEICGQPHQHVHGRQMQRPVRPWLDHPAMHVGGARRALAGVSWQAGGLKHLPGSDVRVATRN